jgi:hypothetical protein
MNRPPMKALALLMFLALVVGCGTSSTSTIDDGEETDQVQLSPTPAQLAGTWQSACIDSGNGHLKFTFYLTASTWEIDYAVFGDDACQAGFMTVNIKGPYELGDASSDVEGARKGNFHFGERFVTPHMEAAVEMLSGACPGVSFVVDQATELAQGCANLGMYPISDCPTDYDIVKLDGNTLYFGARPADNDMCSENKRPTALAFPLAKQN